MPGVCPGLDLAAAFDAAVLLLEVAGRRTAPFRKIEATQPAARPLPARQGEGGNCRAPSRSSHGQRTDCTQQCNSNMRGPTQLLKECAEDARLMGRDRCIWVAQPWTLRSRTAAQARTPLVLDVHVDNRQRPTARSRQTSRRPQMLAMRTGEVLLS